MSNNLNRLRYLDALRGVAVLLVMMVHSTELSNTSSFPLMVANFISSGVFGVQLFFIISAFTLFYTLSIEKKTKTDFYLRRFFRIAPAYYVAILFYSFYSGYWGSGTLLNFAFLHGFAPKSINSIVPGGWSIGIEMFFYLMVPFLFKYINTLNKSILFLSFSFLFKAFCFYLLKLPMLSDIAADGSFIYFWFPNQLPIFAIGFILYFYVQNGSVELKHIYKNLCVLLGMILFVIFTKNPLFSNHIIVAAVFALLIAILAKLDRETWVENKIFLFIGKVSYSAYLCQYGVIFLLRDLHLINIFTNSYANFIYNFTLFAIATLLIAYFFYLIIEKPFQKIGRKLIHSLKLTPLH
ncbi:acyltransferase family protein [Pedobacter kyonggii]|uniref:Acyltransferase n=1 Tax=Pedobacter kyonggii TaxID=1926871 RepID=A0A4Q9HCR2_9SPHI|nr:acyltransferase [Pedobacter kyonggii]TBO42190.1 acyltransferase [Pedobacter kyonggii]